MNFLTAPAEHFSSNISIIIATFCLTFSLILHGIYMCVTQFFQIEFFVYGMFICYYFYWKIVRFKEIADDMVNQTQIKTEAARTAK